MLGSTSANGIGECVCKRAGTRSCPRAHPFLFCCSFPIFWLSSHIHEGISSPTPPRYSSLSLSSHISSIVVWDCPSKGWTRYLATVWMWSILDCLVGCVSTGTKGAILHMMDSQVATIGQPDLQSLLAQIPAKPRHE